MSIKNYTYVKEKHDPCKIETLKTTMYNDSMVARKKKKTPETEYIEVDIFDDAEFEEMDEVFEVMEKAAVVENNLIPTYPNNSYRTIDKVSRNLTTAPLDGHELSLRMEPRNSPVTVTTNFSLTYKGNSEVLNRLTPIEIEVHDSVISLFLSGITNFTPRMIWKTIAGDEDAYVTKRQEKMLEDAISKMAFTEITIDAREELEKFDYHFDEAEISGNLLNIEKIRLRVSGNETVGYRLLRKPILLSYAQPKHQIATIPIRVLSVPVSKTEKAIVLRGYLIRRIEAMKSSARLSRRILYNTIYTYMDDTDASRQQKQKTRDLAEAMMDYWVKENYIAGYEVIRRGRQIHGIEVILKGA